MEAGRTDHPATVEQKEGGPEPPGTLRGVLRHALSIGPMPLTQVTLEAGIWCTQNEAFRGYMPKAPHAVCHADQESRNLRAGAPMSHG